MKDLAFAFAAVVLLVVGTAVAQGPPVVPAQGPPKAAEALPVVPETVKLQAALLASQTALAQTRIADAQKEIALLRIEWEKLVAAHQRDNYVLDTNTWTYAPKPAAVRPPAPPEKK